MNKIEEKTLKISDFKTKIQEFSEKNTIKNPKLTEMINDYLLYKSTENKNYFYFKKNYPNLFSFKKELFSSLENILNDLLYMTNKNSQNEKIESVFQWYKTKINNYKELQFIQEHTKNLPNEKLTEFELKQNDEKFVRNFHSDYIEKNEKNVENREKIFFPKNLLKDFNTKHVFNSCDKNEMKNNKKVFYFNKKIKEIKSSFSFERPDYNFNILMANYNVIQSKNKMLNEKRNLEEIKLNLNDFGKFRARFISENNNKYELMNLIEKYKNKNKIEQKINEKKKKTFNFNFQKENSFIHKKFRNFNRKLMTKSKTTVELFLNKNNKKKKININEIKNINNENIIIKNEKEKIYNFKAKLNISNSKWTIFENLKNNLRKSDDEIYKNENIKSDLIYKFCNNDKIFDTRFKYQTICNINKIDRYKDNYKIEYKPMSIYDITNFKKKSNDSYENFKTNLSILNKTNNEKKWIKNHNDGNFLEMRKTLLNFNLNEFNILRNTLKKSESMANIKNDDNFNIDNNKKIKTYKKISNFTTINETIFNNYEKEYFPKLYLPKSGSGLLNFPENYFISDNKNNKKKKK